MKEDTALVFRLAMNGLRYRVLRRTGRPFRLQAASLEITHHCVARCIMCNIWKIPRTLPMLSLEDWLGLLASPAFSDLRELDITGGEPFFSADLPGLLSGILRLKGTRLEALRSVAITTNGLLTDKVLTETEKILPAVQAAGMGLVMACAMDAIGPLHDQVRNVPGAWEKVNATIQGLMALRARWPNLVIGLKTTILPRTVEELPGLAAYAAKHGLFTILSPVIVTKGRYLNAAMAEELSLGDAHIARIVSFLETGGTGWGFHRQALLRYFATGMMKKPCSCGFNYVFVRSTGEVFPCPLMDRSLGNVRSTAFDTLFRSQKASRFRRRVSNHPECRHCTEPGLERYALPFEGLHYLGMRLRMGPRAFLDLHRHMGLDKYVG